MKKSYACICWIKNTSNTVKYYYNKKKSIFIYLKNVIFSCDGKAEFPAAITSVSHDNTLILFYWIYQYLKK